MGNNVKILVMVVGLMAIGGVFLFGSTFFQYLSTETEIVTRVDKLVEENKSTENKTYLQKQIWTEQGVFLDEPNRLKAKYESKYYDKLIEGNTYKFKLDGKFVKGTGIFPNVLSVEPEKGSKFKDEEKAGNEGEVATESSSAKAEEFYNIGKIQYQRGEYNLAVENYRKAAKLLPDNKNIQINLKAAEAKLK